MAYLWILVIHDIISIFFPFTIHLLTSTQLENASSSLWSRSSHLVKSHLSENLSQAKHLAITLSICVIHFEDIASSESFELPCLIKAIMHCLITTYSIFDQSYLYIYCQTGLVVLQGMQRKQTLEVRVHGEYQPDTCTVLRMFWAQIP